MKVLMLGRFELLTKGGGDKVQVENTASELRKLGVEVDIKTDLNFDPSGYDLVHVFQLDWTPETYLYAKRVKKFGKPLVLSPIHHSVKEVELFDSTYVFDFRRLSKLLFKDQFKRDTFKNVYRSLFSPGKSYPTLFSIIHGFKRMQKETLEMSDIVLVQTQLEANDLEETFGVKIKCEKVLNGVGDNFLKPREFSNPLSITDYILCVGRIEPRKNQLNVIRAVKALRSETGKDIKLVFIGTMSELKHFEYTYYFKNALKRNSWILHINQVPHEEIPAYYHFAKVGVSASWFETTGLTSLEALLSGANAVAAGLRAQEYLGDHASYCTPNDITSIKDALKKEYFSPRPNDLEDLKREYTWENAAKKTLDVYNKLLAKQI